MSKTTTAIQEQIVREGKVKTRLRGFLDQGQAVLTPQHFYFQARMGTWLGLFGLLGLLVRSALPQKVKVDIPLSSITAIGRGRMSFSRDVFFIETLERKNYQFFSEHQLWLDALRNVLQKQRGAMFVQTNQERWEIQR